MKDTTTKARWVMRWRYEVSAKPVMPGVWRRREGGFVVRGRATDPSGKTREVVRPVEATTADEARQALLAELAAIKAPPARSKTLFATYSASLMARKVRDGSLRSVSTREKWGAVLKLHLIPAFGRMAVEDIRRADILAWRDGIAGRIAAGEVKPSSGNTWLAVLRVVVNAYVVEFELDRNPIAQVDEFDTSVHTTYTDEQPNSLTPEEARAFLGAMGRLYPQHLAMTALGFATGLRPSSLRPLRRCGPSADVLWGEGVLLVRRSHVRKAEVMEKTKTGLRQRLTLPSELMDVLRWHVDRLPAGVMADSDLLFPSEVGRFRSASVLDKPFKAAAKEAELTKHLTPRGMRRTFQDLARAAEVRDVVTRSISGHATETMQRHYSTVNPGEQRGALAKVVDLAGFRDALAGAKAAGGAQGGVNEGVNGAAEAAIHGAGNRI